MTRAHYEAETFIENRLDAPLKAIVGTNHGRKWPRFKTNDIKGLLERGTIADLEKLIANPGRKYREQYAHTYAINALKTVADSELLPDDVRALVQYVLELREKASDP